jgi:hypothetical protein
MGQKINKRSGTKKNPPTKKGVPGEKMMKVFASLVAVHVDAQTETADVIP